MLYRSQDIASELLCMHVTKHPWSKHDLSELLLELKFYLQWRNRLRQATHSPEMLIVSPSLKLARQCVIEDSYTDDLILCLEDGKPVKMLRRYLKVKYAMTPQDYCATWDLPTDYPMTAPGYGRTRSRMARSAGLGRVQKS